jgi:DNA-binding MarR family transcriptional regulator
MAHRIGLLFQISRTHQVNARLVGRALAPTGLRGDDYAVYSYLLQGPTTLTGLAEGTGLPLTTAAGYVQRFEDRGHVRKERNPEDGRSRLISLTPESESMIREAAAVFSRGVGPLRERCTEAGIDLDRFVEELATVQAVLEGLVAEPAG